MLVFGNGGSAADAQHLAAELVGRFQRERRGFAAMALTADTSLLTSLANDYGFERVFARQIEALGRRATWRSRSRRAASRRTSWRRSKAARASRAADDRAHRAATAATLAALAEIHMNVPESDRTVQEVHITLIHAICEIVGMPTDDCRADVMPELRTETMTVNMGPQHPSTHGVLRLVLELSGETVVSADTTIGYLHTGIEKTAEQKKWQQVIPLVERMDYLGAQSNSLAFCLSVEKLLGHRNAPARPQHPRAHRRAAAARQPPGLARPRTRSRLAPSP